MSKEMFWDNEVVLYLQKQLKDREDTIQELAEALMSAMEELEANDDDWYW